MSYEYTKISDKEYLVTFTGGEELRTFTVVVFESEDEIASLVEAYLAATSIFSTPEAPAPAYPRLPVRDFLALFTRQEKLDIKAATRVSDELGLWYDEMLAAQFITVEDPDTLMGLAVMVEAGLITAERSDAIIARMQPAAANYSAAPV